MTAGPQLSVTEVEAGSGCGWLVVAMGRKASWAAAVAARAGLERLAGPAGWAATCWASAREENGCWADLKRRKGKE
jgi:hypothetical protein